MRTKHKGWIVIVCVIVIVASTSHARDPAVDTWLRAQEQRRQDDLARDRAWRQDSQRVLEERQERNRHSAEHFQQQQQLQELLDRLEQWRREDR